MSQKKRSRSGSKGAAERLIARAEAQAEAGYDTLVAELLPQGLRDALDVTDLKEAIEKRRAAAAEAMRQAEAQEMQSGDDESHEEGEDLFGGPLPDPLQQMAMAGASMLEQLVLKAAESKSQIDFVLRNLRVTFLQYECKKIAYEKTPSSKAVAKLLAYGELKESEAELQGARRHVERTIEFAQSLIRQARSITNGGGGMVQIVGFGGG